MGLRGSESPLHGSSSAKSTVGCPARYSYVICMIRKSQRQYANDQLHGIPFLPGYKSPAAVSSSIQFTLAAPQVSTMLRSNLSLLIIGCSCLLFAVATRTPITPRSCPENETYLTCGPDCQTECATLGKPCLIRHIRCPDACYCNEGFARNARNAGGTCIPIRQCSGGGYGN
ncbi:mucin-6 [Drosophila santomea]|uniref:mucin-6 n=1 Tax=Drosophila santomea TaxID=129105 RepID=UPI0019535605|nr:mucin-6 [Drosophila santomea]